MTTAAASSSAHDLYDPDAVVPQNSPLLVPKKVTFRPSPSPPLDIPPVQVSPSPSPGGRKTKRRPKVRPSQGDAVLVAFMDNGRHPDIATRAGEQALASESEEYSSSPDTDSSCDETEDMVMSEERGERLAGQNAESVRRLDKLTSGPSSDLQTLAGGALALAGGALAKLALGDRKTSSDEGRTPTTGGDTDIEASRPSQSSPPPAAVPLAIRKDDRPQPLVPASYSPRSYCSPGSFTSPTGSLAGHGELPPIQSTSPRSDTNGGMSLPSIRDQLGLEALSPTFQHSPPAIPPSHGMPRLPSISHTSPPISPHDIYSRDPRSPHALLSPSSYYPFPANALSHRPSVDYNSGSTPSTEQSASTPATSTHSVADRMSLDGLAFSNPQEVGQYICKYEGCKAPPFQTQYLLNSHANVHSQSRPHYCPVKGCPRSEGGRGFKRKNEMIRHGLVHDSPGYVCPFCPDREHKYPRPDNLQRYVRIDISNMHRLILYRHVRVHHMDKDKDDPALRDVLSQRPDGPSRGRRRRGGPL